MVIGGRDDKLCGWKEKKKHFFLKKEAKAFALGYAARGSWAGCMDTAARAR
jgi:hypothetical protein